MLLKVKPYQIGSDIRTGKTHKINESDPSRTLCGKIIQDCPGETIPDTLGVIDCKGCLNVIESKKRQAEWRAKFEAEQAERELKKQQETEEWFRQYDAYLNTPEWRERRRLVMRRANGMCEGCGIQKATQVHHLTYTRLRNEMLFDLVAICDDCHCFIHSENT